MVTVPTTPLARAADGTPWSREFEDVYHASQGGLAQARHVFLGGNGLPQRWASRPSFAILETGFGVGLNFLATWDAWRRDASASSRLHFVSIERAPFARDDLAAALAPFAEIQPLAQALVRAWPPPLRGLHRMAFDGGRVMLTVGLGEADALMPSLVGGFDALFLDGFSPARNPQMWSPPLIRELARLAVPGATLATWTVAGGVRAALADAGFRVQKLPGFGSKREMLAGVREGTESRRAIDRRAVVVGGGLAGTLVAERLASRDWDVELLDGRTARSNAAVGLVRPIVNMRDALNARLSRSAFLFSLQHFQALQLDGYHLEWRRSGVLQLAEDEDEAARFAAIVRGQGHPPAFLEYRDAHGAAALAGRAVRGGGWWFPSGAWVAPESLAVASLARAGPRVRRHTGRVVAKVEQLEGRWRALDDAGSLVADAPVLVLANGADAKRLAPEAGLMLSAVRGQVSYLPPDPARALDIIVSGTGYVAPRPDGAGLCVGASYRHDDVDGSVRASDHRENLERAESMLPGLTAGLHPMQLDGWTGFRATVPDRLPIFGETIQPGLAMATGLGSRGLLWAPIGAELLACALSGEPWPLLREHAAAISPQRFR